ncbi:hypothetical protein UM48_004716 [Salmonella enterica subsp. enterica]|nr:hypothetical protein [Salmonella enterica subsp. enterica]
MNDKTPNLLTIGASALNQKVKDTVSGITSGEKTLVSLVAVIADRWFTTDKGGVDVVQNFINALSDYPAKQNAAAKLFKSFLPLLIAIDEDGKATVQNDIKLSALDEAAKATLKAAIEAFKAANFPSLAKAVAPATGKKEPVKLDLLTTTTKTAKAVNKILEKALADGVDRGSALKSILTWVESELKALEPAKEETPKAA